MQSIWHCSTSPPIRAAASEFVLDRPFPGFEGDVPGGNRGRPAGPSMALGGIPGEQTSVY